MKKRILKGVSLFAGAGIGETFLHDIGIDIVVSNELIQKRADLYKACHKNCNVVCGDITRKEIFDKIISKCQEYGPIDFLIASPPCQGMSVVGKNRTNSEMIGDERNFLFYRVIDSIKILKPDYILIENVPTLLKLLLPFNGKMTRVVDIIRELIPDDYVIKENIYDAAYFGVPQHRKRAIIRIYKTNLKWKDPILNTKFVTVREAIGHLPSLEADEKSDIPWHFARKHKKENVECMKHTPTGCTAFDNKIFFPKNKNGTRIKGYQSSYRRIKWDEPAPTITIRNDCISSQRNVHPGRLLPDGTYSDARVLTPLELMILDSLPKDWIPEGLVSEILIRQCIGESIPPLMVKKIVEGIFDE